MMIHKGQILTCASLEVGYEKQQPLISDLNWSLASNQTWALLGRNGTGKSSLFKTLTGILKPLKGTVRPGIDYSGKSISDILRFTPTQRTANQNMTVRHFIELGAYKRSNWLGKLDNQEAENILTWSEKLAVADWLGKRIGTLSDGQFQRVRICQALVSESPLLMLDEPTAFLDFEGREEVLQLLKDVQSDTGIGLVFSTHELDLASRFASHFMLLHGEGRYNILKAPQTASDLKEKLLIGAEFPESG